jgi:Tol biopolymer transport system component
MYITFPVPKRNELWVSDVDGGNKVKLATGERLRTGTWAQDNFHLSFFEQGADAGPKAYVVGADGSGLRQLPRTGDIFWGLVWSPDQTFLYVSGGEKRGSMQMVWRWSIDSSQPEKFVDNCGEITDADSTGQYLLGRISSGEKTGTYEVSIDERKCISLLPGVASIATFSRDGKSFLYAIASRGEVTIYRQPWRDGKLIGTAQVALKVHFTLPLEYHGNAYDFSRDLSTIVYARPGGHQDLYLLSQK